MFRRNKGLDQVDCFRRMPTGNHLLLGTFRLVQVIIVIFADSANAIYTSTFSNITYGVLVVVVVFHYRSGNLSIQVV